jgi:hypothetical protein
MLTEFTITILTSHDPKRAENEIRTAILAAGYVIEDFITEEVEGEQVGATLYVKKGDQVVVDDTWNGHVDAIKTDTDGTAYATIIDQEGDANDIDVGRLKKQQ